MPQRLRPASRSLPTNPFISVSRCLQLLLVFVALPRAPSHRQHHPWVQQCRGELVPGWCWPLAGMCGACRCRTAAAVPLEEESGETLGCHSCREGGKPCVTRKPCKSIDRPENINLPFSYCNQVSQNNLLSDNTHKNVFASLQAPHPQKYPQQHLLLLGLGTLLLTHVKAAQPAGLTLWPLLCIDGS